MVTDPQTHKPTDRTDYNTLAQCNKHTLTQAEYNRRKSEEHDWNARLDSAWRGAMDPSLKETELQA